MVPITFLSYAGDQRGRGLYGECRRLQMIVAMRTVAGRFRICRHVCRPVALGIDDVRIPLEPENVERPNRGGVLPSTEREDLDPHLAPVLELQQAAQLLSHYLAAA